MMVNPFQAGQQVFWNQHLEIKREEKYQNWYRAWEASLRLFHRDYGVGPFIVASIEDYFVYIEYQKDNETLIAGFTYTCFQADPPE